MGRIVLAGGLHDALGDLGPASLCEGRATLGRRATGDELEQRPVVAGACRVRQLLGQSRDREVEGKRIDKGRLTRVVRGKYQAELDVPAIARREQVAEEVLVGGAPAGLYRAEK